MVAYVWRFSCQRNQKQIIRTKECRIQVIAERVGFATVEIYQCEIIANSYRTDAKLFRWCACKATDRLYCQMTRCSES